MLRKVVSFEWDESTFQLVLGLDDGSCVKLGLELLSDVLVCPSDGIIRYFFDNFKKSLVERETILKRYHELAKPGKGKIILC